MNIFAAMNRIFDLIWLAVRQYFKHPVENIRQADPIKPARLYENYGYICKAVPYNAIEQAKVNADDYDRSLSLDDKLLLELVRSKGLRNKEGIESLQRDALEASSTPVSCQLCDFAKTGIPCPLYNRLKDGSTVCDTHKYVILKRPKI